MRLDDEARERRCPHGQPRNTCPSEDCQRAGRTTIIRNGERFVFERGQQIPVELVTAANAALRDGRATVSFGDD